MGFLAVVFLKPGETGAEDRIFDNKAAGEAGPVTQPSHVTEPRRTAVPTPEDDTISIGEIALSPSLREVAVSGKRVHLTPKQFDFLLYLMQNAGKPIRHSKLLTTVWGVEYGQELEYLRTLMRQLRLKLEKDPSHPEYLLTEPWFGYRFRAQERVAINNA